MKGHSLLAVSRETSVGKKTHLSDWAKTQRSVVGGV